MTPIEKALLPLSRSHPRLHEFLWFGLKQAWACIFGALLLAGILATHFWYPDIPFARYDFLVFYAIAIQVSLYLLKLESWREIGVILLHLYKPAEPGCLDAAAQLDPCIADAAVRLPVPDVYKLICLVVYTESAIQ